MSTARSDGRRGGFTLIELLVVMGVIVVLAGLSIPAVSAIRKKSQVGETAAMLERLKLALATYQNDFGDYPPSSPRRLGLRGNGQNDGGELLLRCLTTRRKTGNYIQLDDRFLGNVDGDRLPSADDPTGSAIASRELLEVLDTWGNPLCYLHNADYDKGGAVTLPTPDGAGTQAVQVAARKSEKTSQYLGLTTWQLWSAGPDEQAGTDDDVFVWGE